MRLLISTAIALTAAFVAGGPASDLVAAPKPANPRVTITFTDGGAIQSDGQGAYVGGSGGVVAYLGANGELIFGTNTSNKAGRTLQFNFNDCLSAPEDCDAPWGYLNENSGLQANALRNGSVPPGGLLAMGEQEELAAWIKFNIPLDTDPAYWNVCFDSRKVVGPCGAAPGGTSTDARVVRNGPTQWTISANGTGDRGDLIRDSNTGRSRTYTVMGTYSMPFSFTVQCVNANCS